MASVLCLVQTKICAFETARHRKRRECGWIFSFETAGALTRTNGEKGKSRRRIKFSAYCVRLSLPQKKWSIGSKTAGASSILFELKIRIDFCASAYYSSNRSKSSQK